MSQNPDPSSGPAPEMCRYTKTAIPRGARSISSHSTTNSAPLTANETGTITRGTSFADTFEFTATSAIETNDVTMNMVGSAVKSN